MAITRFQTGTRGKIRIKEWWVDGVSYRIPEIELAETEGLPEEKFGRITAPGDDSLIFSIWDAGKATLYLDDGSESWDFQITGDPIFTNEVVTFQIQRVLKADA